MELIVWPDLVGPLGGGASGSRGSSPCSVHPQPDPVVLQSRHPADARQHSSQQREGVEQPEQIRDGDQPAEVLHGCISVPGDAASLCRTADSVRVKCPLAVTSA